MIDSDENDDDNDVPGHYLNNVKYFIPIYFSRVRHFFKTSFTVLFRFSDIQTVNHSLI